jgi:type I restriction enzyme S subunit
MRKLKPYPEYKDSGVPWLGEVPAHWEQRPLFAITKIKNVRGRADLPLLSVYRDYGVILRDSRDDNYNPQGADLSTYKVVSPGDLVLNKMKTWQGSLGVSDHLGIVSPAYIVCELYGSFERRFIHYLLRSRPYVHGYNQLSFGVRVNQWDMRYDDFKRIPVALPPIEEQRAIARFLDHHDRLTRRYIRTQRRLIELLTEQKQALIQRAVTRGLDPDVPLKDSGIEWLGEIPEHWEVQKLKRLARQIVDGTHFTPTYIDFGVPFLRVTDIQSSEIDFQSVRYISQEEHDLLNKRCNPENGDVLLSKNGTIGITRVVDWDFPFSIFVSLCLIKPLKRRLDPYFLSYTFQGKLFDTQFMETTKTTSVTNLHLDKINNLILALPPVNEQRRIVGYLDSILVNNKQAISRARCQIDLIREYRTRLIADVVTGKLDVRGVSTPDLDEAGDVGDLDEPIEDVEMDDPDAEELDDADD